MLAIAVVVPYFAHGPAALARTVRAALSQRDVPTPLVIVVDDGSPWPASAELAALDPQEMANVRLIRQANGGPSRARNAGLDAVPDDVAWIALVDANDTWAPDHLVQAIDALTRGYDFYFCNHERIDVGVPHYACCGFKPAEHPLLTAESTLHEFKGDFFARNLTFTPVGTSTVVYRRSKLGSVRFPTFPWAWEDLMFWLDVASRTQAIAFDEAIRVVYGPSGIAGVGGWRSQAELQRKLWYIQHFTNVRARFQLTREQAAIVTDALRSHTEGFAGSVLGLMRYGALPKGRILFDFVRWRLAVIPTFFSVAVRTMVAHVLGGADAGSTAAVPLAQSADQ